MQAASALRGAPAAGRCPCAEPPRLGGAARCCGPARTAMPFGSRTTPSGPTAERQHLNCRRAGSHVAKAASEPAAAKDPKELRIDLLKGCKTVMAELQGLDFPRAEVRGYFQYVVKPPRGVKQGFDMGRTKVVVNQIIDGKEDTISDMEALTATQLMLSDIWRWRRRGGGMDDETDRPSHIIALEALQNIQPEQIDRITSSLLDNLPISEEEKREMSGSVQQAAMAGINGAVWGSLVACLLALLVFNFIRGT